MSEGVVQAIGASRNGKPTVTVDSQLYYSGDTSLAGMNVGDRISFQANSSWYKGTQNWFLNAWKPLGRAEGAPSSTEPHKEIAAPSSASAPQKASIGLTEGERLTVSNWVAAAIQAGKIEGPADINAWAQAALHAIRGAGNPNYVPF